MQSKYAQKNYCSLCNHVILDWPKATSVGDTFGIWRFTQAASECGYVTEKKITFYNILLQLVLRNFLPDNFTIEKHLCALEITQRRSFHAIVGVQGIVL